MICQHNFKRQRIGISGNVYSECETCTWQEDTGSVVVTAAQFALINAFEEANEAIADVRVQLGEFWSEDVVVMAKRARQRIKDLEAASRDLLQYLDDHDWGLVPEGETSDRLRDLLTAPSDFSEQEKQG